ncbi:MAG: sensor histidine kinase [Chloroflexota bacterium]
MKGQISNRLQTQLFTSYLWVNGVTLCLLLLWLFLPFLRQSPIISIGLLIFVVLMNLSLSVYFSRKLSKPFIRMKEVAEQFSCDPHHSIQVKEDDPVEIQDLVHTLNSMGERTEHRISELRSFVANASHELRTPLTTVKLRVEALRDGAMEDREIAGRFLNEVEGEIDSLTKMVSDLLDLSRIEAGVAEIDRADVDFGNIVREVCSAFGARAQRSNIRLNCVVEDHLPPLAGIEDQLRRMVYNLVDNALKYTASGGWVEVGVEKIPSANLIRLRVKDSGFGIPSTVLPHIFERFYRVEATRPRYGHARGSGLGLAIVKAIADVHGAQVRVESEVGKGTCFTIDFPLAICT